MNSERNEAGGRGLLMRLKRIGAGVGRVQAASHTKKDMIKLRRRRWAMLRKRLRGEKEQPEEQTEEPAEEQPEQETEES